MLCFGGLPWRRKRHEQPEPPTPASQAKHSAQAAKQLVKWKATSCSHHSCTSIDSTYSNPLRSIGSHTRSVGPHTDVLAAPVNAQVPHPVMSTDTLTSSSTATWGTVMQAPPLASQQPPVPLTTPTSSSITRQPSSSPRSLHAAPGSLTPFSPATPAVEPTQPPIQPQFLPASVQAQLLEPGAYSVPLLGPNIYAGARHLRRLFQLTLPGVKPVAIEDSDQAELPMTILARTASNGIRGSLDADSAQLGETAPFKGMQSKAVTEDQVNDLAVSPPQVADCLWIAYDIEEMARKHASSLMSAMRIQRAVQRVVGMLPMLHALEEMASSFDILLVGEVQQELGVVQGTLEAVRLVVTRWREHREAGLQAAAQQLVSEQFHREHVTLQAHTNHAYRHLATAQAMVQYQVSVVDGQQAPGDKPRPCVISAEEMREDQEAAISQAAADLNSELGLFSSVALTTCCKGQDLGQILGDALIASLQAVYTAHNLQPLHIMKIKLSPYALLPTPSASCQPSFMTPSTSASNLHGASFVPELQQLVHHLGAPSTPLKSRSTNFISSHRTTSQLMHAHGGDRWHAERPAPSFLNIESSPVGFSGPHASPLCSPSASASFPPATPQRHGSPLGPTTMTRPIPNNGSGQPAHGPTRDWSALKSSSTSCLGRVGGAQQPLHFSQNLLVPRLLPEAVKLAVSSPPASRGQLLRIPSRPVQYQALELSSRAPLELGGPLDKLSAMQRGSADLSPLSRVMSGLHDPAAPPSSPSRSQSRGGHTQQSPSSSALPDNMPMTVVLDGVQWSLGAQLGEGAYGKVFAALDNVTGRQLAVKVIKVSSVPDVEVLQRELDLYCKLSHPHIVSYAGCHVDHASDVVYIFMELTSGGCLCKALAQYGAFNEQVVRTYTRQILLGLEYLHSQRIVHRDLKGANILITVDGVVKLGDFGTACVLPVGPPLPGGTPGIGVGGTMTLGAKSLRGSIYWISPEIVKGTGHGRRADIWSLGCTVIEMLTGRPPWPDLEGETHAWGVMLRIATSTTGPPRPPNISPAARGFLDACLRINPEDRPRASKLLQHPFITGEPMP